MKKTIETKVIAALAGSGGGAALSGFVLWLLGVTVWHTSNSAGAAASALAAVPSPVTLLVGVVLSILGAFVGGYAAPHTDRTAADLRQKPVDPDPFVSSTKDNASAATAADQASALKLLTPPAVKVDSTAASLKIAAIAKLAADGPDGIKAWYPADNPASTEVSGQDSASAFTPLTPSATEATA